MENLTYPECQDVVEISSDEGSDVGDSDTAEYGSSSGSRSPYDGDIDSAELRGCDCRGCSAGTSDSRRVQTLRSSAGLLLIPSVPSTEEYINQQYPESYYWTPSDDEDEGEEDDECAEYDGDDEDGECEEGDEEDEDMYIDMTPYNTPEPVDRELMDFMGEDEDLDNNVDKYGSKCTVCLDKQPCVTFFGCQHVSTFERCIRGIQIVSKGGMVKCPLCNLPSGYVVGRLP